jgi:cytochrome b6-f complex iron-sulfur subunit
VETQTLILIGVAVVALAAAVGAFTIAYRRSTGRDWRGLVERDARRADRSRERVVEPVAVAAPERVEEERAVEAETEPEPTEEPHRQAEPVGVAVVEEQRVVEVSPEEAGVTRRQFLNRALSGTFFAFLGILGIDILAFLWPRLSGGFGADVNAGSVDDIRASARTADGSVVPVFIPEARAYVVPALGGEQSEQFAGRSVVAGGLMALYQRCVHLGCRVPWCQTSQGFECPCHGSKYSAIGEYFAGPAPRNLDRFVVEVSETGDFIIHTGQIIETPRAPRLAVPYPQGPSCI